MPKKTIKRFTPSPHKIREIKALRILGEWIYEPNLWHINRQSTAKAFAVGLFCAMLPIPGQMVVAALFAVQWRANLPLSVALVFITNPFTMPVIFYAAYKLGVVLLGSELKDIEFQISWDWLSQSLHAIWEPFLLGCLMMGLGFAGIAYLMIDALWRHHVVSQWRKRQASRRKD